MLDLETIASGELINQAESFILFFFKNTTLVIGGTMELCYCNDVKATANDACFFVDSFDVRGPSHIRPVEGGRGEMMEWGFSFLAAGLFFCFNQWSGWIRFICSSQCGFLFLACGLFFSFASVVSVFLKDR